MLDTLIALTETGEFEDSGGFWLVSVQQRLGALLLEVALNPGNGGGDQRWQIECVGVRAYRLLGEFADRPQLVSEHPVLLPFSEDVTDLYFSCSAPNPLATVGMLWERHRRLVGSWLPFEQFLNVLPSGLSALLASQSGKLASGPVSLMQAYAAVLTEQGVRSSMLPPTPPKYWDGEKWVVPESRLHALLFDGSYVVAERFDADGPAA